MAKTKPWHTIKKDPRKKDVYHNDTSCTEGNNIERENRREGTGGRPLCEHCERLNGGR